MQSPIIVLSQVAYVHLLGDIRAGKIHDNSFGLRGFFCPSSFARVRINLLK